MAIEAARNSTSPPDILWMFGEDQTFAATGYMQEDAADKVIPVGAGRIDSFWVIDVTAIEIASNDESYTHRLLGANLEDFSDAKEVLCTVLMGATEVRALGSADSRIGRYETPFSNSVNGVEYAFIKHHVTINGTIATGTVFSSWLAPPKPE